MSSEWFLVDGICCIFGPKLLHNDSFVQLYIVIVQNEHEILEIFKNIQNISFETQISMNLGSTNISIVNNRRALNYMTKKLL